MTPAPISVERLRELLAKATPGPWIAWENSFSRWQILGGRGVLAGIATPNDPASPPDSWGECEVNAALIAETITALPALLHQLAEAERAREESIDRIITGLSEYGESVCRYEFGLPAYHEHMEAMRSIVRAAFLAASGGK